LDDSTFSITAGDHTISVTASSSAWLGAIVFSLRPRIMSSSKNVPADADGPISAAKVGNGRVVVCAVIVASCRCEAGDGPDDEVGSELTWQYSLGHWSTVNEAVRPKPLLLLRYSNINGQYRSTEQSNSEYQRGQPRRFDNFVRTTGRAVTCCDRRPIQTVILTARHCS
jgi:hypothetical protein